MDELCESLRCHYHGWHMLALSTGNGAPKGDAGMSGGLGNCG
jgi:hypothetical protein